MVLMINLLVNFIGAIKLKAQECISVLNQKCMARPKVIQEHVWQEQTQMNQYFIH